MRRLSPLQLAVRLLVAALCGVALLQAIRPAVHSARSGLQTARTAHLQHPSRQYRERQEYLSDEIGRQVPVGTKVVVVGKELEQLLRLIEYAVLQGLVVVSEGADVEVSIQMDPAAPHGVRLLTRKLAGA
jgi:hypothetical protein